MAYILTILLVLPVMVFAKHSGFALEQGNQVWADAAGHSRPCPCHQLDVRGGGIESQSDDPSESLTEIRRVVQVHIVHRHGDRTPITPLKDEAFWGSSLPQQAVLDKIASNTKIIRDEVVHHKAGGSGVFGKLTQMGLFQMVDLGSTLLDELCSSEPATVAHDDAGNAVFQQWEIVPSRRSHSSQPNPGR